MQMHGHMARVPVTARQKFSEAAYFYNGMLPHRTNPVVFPYYLSGFVSALRSVTYYLQKQYAHDERFKEWYAQKRNTALHVEPFDLCFKQGWKMPDKYGGVITTTFLAVREEAEPNGRVRTFLKVENDGPEEEVETQISWHFTDDDPQDVMNHCYEGLEKMDAMLKELTSLGLDENEGGGG